MKPATYFLALIASAACFAACSDDSSTDTTGGDSGTDAGASLDGGGSSDGATGSDAKAGSDGASGADGGTNGQWVLGYHVGYQINDYPIAQIDWSGLTHIIFAPMTVKADHSLDVSFDDSNGTGPADATALATAAHGHGVKALLMLGGAGAGSNIAAAASAANRAAFVTALLNAVSTLGYDGIDLDWEDSVNLDDLVSLAQALRAAKSDIVLTYPSGAINGNFQTVDARMVTLAASLDRFNVQTYYPSTALVAVNWDSWFTSPVSGVTANTPIAIDDTLQRYADAGIPKAKLGMGMSFYAICYSSDITGPRQPTSVGTTQILGGDNNYPLSAFFAAGSTFATATAGEVHLDATAKVPYLALDVATSDTHCGGNTRYISYDDETSIIARGTFSKDNGYGGIIVWTLAQGWLPSGATGGRAQNALMQALKTGFLDP